MLFIVVTVVMMVMVVMVVMMKVMVMMLNVAHSSMYDMIFVVTKTKTKMTKTLKITFHSSGTTSASTGIHFTGSNKLLHRLLPLTKVVRNAPSW